MPDSRRLDMGREIESASTPLLVDGQIVAG